MMNGSKPAPSAKRERASDAENRALNSAGLGHVFEITDADAPHTPRGCPFQAWSVAELIRLDRMVLRVADEQEIRASSRAHAASNG
jgi:glycogen debranching enzyme